MDGFDAALARYRAERGQQGGERQLILPDSVRLLPLYVHAGRQPALHDGRHVRHRRRGCISAARGF